MSIKFDGMQIDQLINMLHAARDQGARYVQIARQEAGLGVQHGVDWVSMRPVDGCVYVGCLPEQEVLSNEAAESLDW